ncbi:MAG: argininosuccinate lyase [Halobacteriota archaeon]
MTGDDGDVIRGTRFSGGPARAFMSSLADDERLFEADLDVDRAHVVMLAETGIIDDELAGSILGALETIEDRGFDELPPGEDIHAAIETAVIDLVGEAGGSMHTARSRNDEVATCIRHRVRDDLLALIEATVDLRETLLAEAEHHREILLPGYTHLQPAQPTTVGHWLLSYEAALARDADRLFDAYERTNRSPLGAAAFAGTSFDIDRERTATLLGFDGVLENAMDAVSTRDFLLEVTGAGVSLAITLAGVATDLTLFANRGFVDLDDDFASTSSIMPQKKNPDAMELVRACVGDAVGTHQAVAATLKGLPRAYNRDLQRATPHGWHALDTLEPAVTVTEGTVATLAWTEDVLATASGEGFSTATAVADALTRAGLPFRTAHTVVAEVAAGTTEPTPEAIIDALEGLETPTAIDVEVIERAFDPAATVADRDSLGGPAPAAVAASVDRCRVRLDADRARLTEHHRALEDARDALRAEVAGYG